MAARIENTPSRAFVQSCAHAKLKIMSLSILNATRVDSDQTTPVETAPNDTDNGF